MPTAHDNARLVETKTARKPSPSAACWSWPRCSAICARMSSSCWANSSSVAASPSDVRSAVEPSMSVNMIVTGPSGNSARSAALRHRE